MIDRHVNDVSYGHLGEAVYDEEGKRWSFSRDTALPTIIQPVHPFVQCKPPSIRVQNWRANPGDARTNVKCLAGNFPETGPAWEILSSLARDSTIADLETTPLDGALLALGEAADVGHTSGSRSVPILAIAYGESGECLRLIKPRIENCAWEGDGHVKLRTFNVSLSEDGFWFEGGGSICQISFGSDVEGLTSWLAVRKSDSTSILRPIYLPTLQPQEVPHNLSTKFPPSRLHPNHVLTLASEDTGGSPHSHVSFNPWYVRQFAVVDQKGHWTVWNLESQSHKRRHLHAVAGLSGYIRDELLQDSAFTVNPNLDGWSRALWVGSVSTLIVCDRRHLTVFCLKSKPNRLPSPELIPPNSSSWILDVKRHPNELDKIFVLTTTHIFWLQIFPAGEYNEGKFEEVGAKVLLSCRHFRDSNKAALNIELLIESEEVCTVLLYSSQNLLVNTCRFTTKVEDNIHYSCSFDAFLIPRNPGQAASMKSLCITPASFVPSTQKVRSGPGGLYINRGVRFYQAFGIDACLGLSHTLLATSCATSEEPHAKYGRLLYPKISSSRRLNVLSSSRISDDDFVIMDGLDEAEETIGAAAVAAATVPHNNHNPADEQTMSLHSKWIDARPVYKYFFHDTPADEKESESSPDVVNSMALYIENIASEIKIRVQDGVQGTNTLAEYAMFSSFDSDVDEAAKLFTELVVSSNQNGDQLPFRAFVSGMRLYNTSEGQLEARRESLPTLSNIYDALVDFWVSSLPRKTPGPTRLARERLVRHIAAELYLSANTISIRDTSVGLTRQTESTLLSDFVLPVRAKAIPSQHVWQKPGYAAESDQPAASNENFTTTVPEPSASLPAASQKLSSSFHEETRHLDQPAEDPAIARLRAYAVSINSQPPLTTIKSSILSHWPSSPGNDPSDYIWESTRRTADTTDIETEEDGVTQRRREKQLRRQRTEIFLRGEKELDIGKEAVSQPAPPLWTESQPDFTRDMLSSQPVLDEISMTQPDKGLHGSRKMQKPSKRRTKGF